MRCYLAAFDQAHLSADRTYWTWHHPDLSMHVLDNFLYDCATKHWPDEAAPIAAIRIRGGFASVDRNWFCWYRFLEGGRDKVGRPGRVVLLAAFVRALDHRDLDWSGVLESPQFNEVAVQVATKCPVPVPDSMELTWDPMPVFPDVNDGSNILDEKRADFEGPSAVQTALVACSRLPSEFRIDCSLNRGSDGDRVVLIVLDRTSTYKTPPAAELQSATALDKSQDVADVSPPNEYANSSHGRFLAIPAFTDWARTLLSRRTTAFLAVFSFGFACGVSAGWYLPWDRTTHTDVQILSKSRTIPTSSSPSRPSEQVPSDQRFDMRP